MPEEIYNPVSSYRDTYKDAFRLAAEEEFQRLESAANIDAAENAARVREINRLEAELNSAKSHQGCMTTIVTLMVILIIVGVLSGFGLVADAMEVYDDGTRGLYAFGGFGGAVVAIILLVSWVLPARRRAVERTQRLENELYEAKEAAWEQMEPLNQRFDWDVTARLIKKVCPILNIDPYFTSGRLNELEGHFGWSRSYHGDDRSILFSQSGDIVGNPFAFGEELVQTWEDKVYTGYLTIHWTETYTDSEGKSHEVTRSETLVAHYTAPAPEYSKRSFLIYGNDAAPNLCFSRKPTGLANDGDGWFSGMRKRHALKKLKKFSENLLDESQYTLMSNHDFEVLFHSTDRNDEIQFRLLYTPLAMQQTVELLKDQTVGYGDDFTFIKENLLNLVIPNHLQGFSLDTNPVNYATYDLEACRSFFISRNEEYFRQVFFSLAPLLCIPLYQQHRTAKTIYGYTPGEESCFWEHESMANYFGDKRFKHPDCITRCILKTRKRARKGNTSTIDVTAYGFRGINRVEYVECWGGDGQYHLVPVEWVEYLPVERTSSYSLCELEPQPENDEARPLAGPRTNLDDYLDKIGVSRAYAAYRRSVFAWME